MGPPADPAGTLGTASAPPLALTLWRFVLAGTLLAGLALATRAPWPRTRRAWVDATVTGVLLQGLQFTGVYLGLAYGTSAALSALVISLSVLIVQRVARRTRASVPVSSSRSDGTAAVARRA